LARLVRRASHRFRDSANASGRRTLTAKPEAAPSSLAPQRQPPRPEAVPNSIRLFTIAGIDVAIHVSWFVIAGLVTWSLAVGFFPTAVPDASAAEYWIFGAIAAALLFASVLAHELAHSFVAKAKGLKVRSITLFLFGGVSNLSGEARRPGAEFQIAIVGPITSFGVAGVALLVAVSVNGYPPIEATARYLALINAALALFNLVPGFPLDGGRVLRSIIWSATNDLRRATELATATGRVVAWAMMLWGFSRVLGGDVFGGIWIAAIGWFLDNAAVATLQQTVLETHLRKLKVGDVIRPDSSGAGPSTSVSELIERYVLPGARRAVPIVADGAAVGIVTLADIQNVPLDERPTVTVEEIMTGRDQLVTVSSSTPLQAAIDALASGDYEQVPVVDGGRLVGLLTRADVLRELQIREALDLQTPEAESSKRGTASRAGIDPRQGRGTR
jgi:Zn-dependent protease/CBS domain-containing protein